MQLPPRLATITNLKKDEKFYYYKNFCGIKTNQKRTLKRLEKEIKNFAKENLYDDGTGKSEATNYFGAEVLVKYSYPKPTLDSEKLKTELERAFAELNVDFDDLQFLKPTTPRQTVIIQSILTKQHMETLYILVLYNFYKFICQL